MQLSPTKILHLLGFNIDESGVSVNEFDYLLICESLRLAGETIDVNNIPANELAELRLKLHTLAGRTPNPENEETGLLKLRTLIDANLRVIFNRNT